MKVALVAFPMNVSYAYSEQLGPECVAQALRDAGHEVEIFEEMAGSSAASGVADFRPDLLGLSPYDSGVLPAFETARRVKEVNPEAHVVAGGVWATFNAQAILLAEPAVDSVCLGEGEITAVELAEAVRCKNGLSGVAGLAWRRGSAVVQNGGRVPARDLDALPFAARDMLERRLRQVGQGVFAQVSTTRGCTGRCAFCCVPRFTREQGGAIWRGRSPERVVDELVRLRNTYGVRQYWFTDSNFLDPGKKGVERADRLARLMVERGVNAPFFAFMCADSLREADRALIDRLMAAGLSKVYLGVESGTRETLKLYEKRATRQDNIAAIELLNRAGLPVEIGFIMFHPWVTPEEILENMAFLRDVGQAHLLSTICVSLECYEGTTLMDRVRSEGLLREDWSFRKKYAYRFKRDAMGELAQSFRMLVNQPWARQFDFHLKQLDSWEQQSRRYPTGERLAERAGWYRSAREEISAKNSRFVADAAALAESGWDTEVYSRLEEDLRRFCEPIGAEAQSTLSGLMGRPS